MVSAPLRLAWSTAVCYTPILAVRYTPDDHTCGETETQESRVSLSIYTYIYIYIYIDIKKTTSNNTKTFVHILVLQLCSYVTRLKI